MKRTLALLVALMVAAVFGGATLASADCAYHKSQAAVDKPVVNQETATTQPAPDKANADQVQTAQAPRPAQPPVEVKK
jgi:hypothetical protein